MNTGFQLSYNLGGATADADRTFTEAECTFGQRRRRLSRDPSIAVERLETGSDEELIERIRCGSPAERDRSRDVLFRRYYPRVLSWCRRFSGDRQLASDLAQDVLLRVHERLHTFEGKSRFSSWLYTVTRRTVINRCVAARRRVALSLEEEQLPEPIDPTPGADERAEISEIAGELRRAMERDLEPLEAKVLYLHHVDGMTLAAITEMLGLQNKSGAKAFVVNGKRKLDRKFGRWLRRQTTAM